MSVVNMRALLRSPRLPSRVVVALLLLAPCTNYIKLGVAQPVPGQQPPPAAGAIVPPPPAVPNGDPNAQPQQTDPNAQPQGSNPNAQPQQGDPSAQPQTDPNSQQPDPNAQPQQGDPNAQPQADPNAQPQQTDPNAQPQTDPNTQPQQSDPNAQQQPQQTDPSAQPQTDPNAQPQTDPNAQPPVTDPNDPNAGGTGVPYTESFDSSAVAPAPDYQPPSAFAKRPLQQTCAAGIPFENNESPACEWLGSCPGCQTQCVLNLELARIPGEVVGNALADTPPNRAAILCPGLTMFLRYGTQVPASPNLACPSAAETGRFDSTRNARFPAGILASIDRNPQLTAFASTLLATPGSVATFFDTNCLEYLVKGANDTALVQNFLGKAPAAAPGTGGAPLCADSEGTYRSFYEAETTCYTPQPYPFGINYDWRACLGDDAKWLNDNCVFAYINVAGGSTKSVPTLVRVAPQYTDALRTIHFHCMELDENECQRPDSNVKVFRELEKLNGPERYKDKIRSWSNIGVGIYLDRLPTNLRGPNDPPPNTKKGWTPPNPVTWMHMTSAAAPWGAAGGARILVAAGLLSTLLL